MQNYLKYTKKTSDSFFWAM